MSFIDPIHGSIKIPSWLERILRNEVVRRTMFIRQLGLKAYIDFPGAIHTRFSHLIGTMYLAGKLCDILCEKLEKTEAADIIRDQKTNIMVAAFLHDIGHGPFSHAVDFVLKKFHGRSHEELSSQLIEEKFQELDVHSNLKMVSELVTGKYEYPFITSMINGVIDVDRLDFLMRDAYHVGFKYHFDVEQFLSKYNLIGFEYEQDLKKVKLGLDYTDEDKSSVAMAEIFLVMWRNMYELVYFKEKSRVAEKMLQYAILDQKDNRDLFNNLPKHYDESLLRELEDTTGICAELVKSIREGKVYDIVKKMDLQRNVEVSEKLLALYKKDPEEASYQLTKKICDIHCDGKPYIICDIVASKVVHEDIYLTKPKEDGDDNYVCKDVSNVIASINPKYELRLYMKKSNVGSDVDKVVEDLKNIMKDF
jgi:HD superfamily phosphohydrolase